MTRFTPFLGETHDRDAAVPGIDGRPIQWHYNKATMPRRLPAQTECAETAVLIFSTSSRPAALENINSFVKATKARGREVARA